jgi:ubiquinone/menaquinone biosynthesis C-methylase UbiE
MPFEDEYFDAVVTLSSLEFVPDLDAACREVSRVLRPDGAFYVVTPGQSVVLDFGLRLLTGQSASKDFGNRREAILPTLGRHFDVDARVTAPSLGSSILCLYTALKLRPRRDPVGRRVGR